MLSETCSHASRRREGVLAVGRRKLLRVVAPTRDEARLEWNLAVATAFGVDRSVADGRLDETAVDAEEVGWCS